MREIEIPLSVRGEVSAAMPETRQGWQPIETAPRDCDILTTWRGGTITVARWSGYFNAWMANRKDAFKPTHWMPLPDPPSAEDPV